MDNVLLYTRVSTDEQSEKGFSLRDQKAKLEQHCERHGYNVIGHYQDDHSAKTFNRPAFQELLTFVKKHKGQIKRLVFNKWDRFSRNMTDALIMIRELSTYGITCEAIEQPLDLAIPENKLLLAIYICSPEIENDRRSLNVTNGMRRAMKEGRYCCSAPFGYVYSFDEHRKPIIIPEPLKAALVAEAFELYATGLYEKQELLRMLRPKGMRLERAAFSRMFHNVVYCGKIYVKPYKDETEQLVKGVHTGIVSEDLFLRVQTTAKPVQEVFSRPKTAKDELPLRGFLICPSCGGNMTGSASKSMTGTRHFYYHCQPGCKIRFRADKANIAFEDWLEEVSVWPDQYKHRFLQIFEGIQKRENGLRKDHLGQIQKQIDAIEIKLTDLAEGCFVEKRIPLDAYERLKKTYAVDSSNLEAEKARLLLLNSDLIHQTEFVLNMISNLRNLWVRLDITDKRSLLSSILREKLVFVEGKYRTESEKYVFHEVASFFKALEEQTTGNVDDFDGLSCLVVPPRIELGSNV